MSICCAGRPDGADPFKERLASRLRQNHRSHYIVLEIASQIPSACPCFARKCDSIQSRRRRDPAAVPFRNIWRRGVKHRLTLKPAFRSRAQSGLCCRFTYGRHGGGEPHLRSYRNRQFAMVGRPDRLDSSAGRVSSFATGAASLSNTPLMVKLSKGVLQTRVAAGRWQAENLPTEQRASRPHSQRG